MWYYEFALKKIYFYPIQSSLKNSSRSHNSAFKHLTVIERYFTNVLVVIKILHKKIKLFQFMKYKLGLEYRSNTEI